MISDRRRGARPVKGRALYHRGRTGVPVGKTGGETKVI